MLRWFVQLRPLSRLIWGYLGFLLIGFLLLCLPWTQSQDTKVIDHFFSATSALSTTGLATVNIAASYNWLGELIILLLIQLGGLGYMSMGSFIVLMRRNRLSSSSEDLIRYDFSLPNDLDIKDFIKSLIYFTLIIELVGAIFLALIFWSEGESDVIWKGIFHSISAFCTAGFSLFSDGFEGYQNNFYLNLVISFLAIAGAIGFIVFTDWYEKIIGKKKNITFTSRIILRFTFVGMLIGTAILFLGDPNIEQLSAENRLMVAFFQSMTAFTTVGFNTYPIGEIVAAPLFAIILMMVIGASPSGTGGGIKSTTITALYAQLKATFRGQDTAIFMGCSIPEHRVRTAAVNFFFYVVVVCIGIFCLLLVESVEPFAVIFEAVSALGTVGLSTGITEDLSVMGKLIVVILMFLGRIGPLSFGIALFGPERSARPQQEDLAI